MSTRKGKFGVRDLCVVSVAAALICVFSQIRIPLPFGVPITLQTFIIPLIVIVLGTRNGVIATALYVVLGAIGLPVFSNFLGGFGVLFGPTGGFILSFPLLALIVGMGAKAHNPVFLWLGLVMGVTVNFLSGILMYTVMLDSTFMAAFTACVLPFIPADVLKIVLVGLVGKRCRGLLQKAKVIV